jgi:hypothetical protein
MLKKQGRRHDCRISSIRKLNKSQRILVSLTPVRCNAPTGRAEPTASGPEERPTPRRGFTEGIGYPCDPQSQRLSAFCEMPILSKLFDFSAFVCISPSLMTVSHGSGRLTGRRWTCRGPDRPVPVRTRSLFWIQSCLKSVPNPTPGRPSEPAASAAFRNFVTSKDVSHREHRDHRG